MLPRRHTSDIVVQAPRTSSHRSRAVLIPILSIVLHVLLIDFRSVNRAFRRISRAGIAFRGLGDASILLRSKDGSD